MDLFITIIVIIIIIFWPKERQVRYYLLLFLGLGLLFVAVIFAPVVLLSPLFYLGAAVIAVLVFYRGVKFK
ncbi:MAG: hypothetical protein GX989_07925 [Firmicutes bacterium]|nr:hypothetical protein [Bacillota bacterium]